MHNVYKTYRNVRYRNSGYDTTIPLSLHPIDPLCDVGHDFGGDGFFDVAVFGWETGLAMLEEVVE